MNSGRIIYLASAAAIALGGALFFTLGVGILGSIDSNENLSAGEAIAVAWGVISVVLGPCLVVLGVFLGIYAVTER